MSDRAYWDACAEVNRLRAMVMKAEARAARLNPYRPAAANEAQAQHFDYLAASYLDMASENTCTTT